MKIKNIIYLLFLIAGFACENDGINQENLEQVQSKVYLSKTGEIVYSTFDFGESELTYDVYVNKSGYLDQEVDVYFDSDISLSENSGVDTESMKAYPSSAYSFDSDKIHMDADETIAKNTVHIDLNEVRRLAAENPQWKYIIPIRITTQENSLVQVNETKSSLLLSVDLVVPNVELVNKGSVTDYAFDPFRNAGEKELSLPMEINIPFTNTTFDFNFVSEADPALLIAYNEQYGTDYEMLPEGSYTIPEVSMSAGEESKKFNITVALDALDKINGGKYYLLPVRIVSSGNDQIPMEDGAICYFRIKQASKWTGRWDNTISAGETGLSTTPGTTYSTVLYSRIDALENFTESTIVAAFNVITDNDAILCPGWGGTMFEQCSPIIKITDQDAGNGKKVVEILAGWAREGAGWEPVTTANNMSTYDPATNEIYLDYTGTYSWGDYHIQRTYSNQQALD